MTSEIKGVLGIDTSSIPADLAKAKQAFSQGAQGLEQAAGQHGDNAGAKLVGGIEHRLFGARHLSTALATALGLNIEKIAESITSGIVGGSMEAWKEAVKIADENTKIIERLIETRMSPKQVQDKKDKDLNRAISDSKSAGGQTDLGAALDAQGGFLKQAAEALGLAKTDAERLNETLGSTLKINEADLRVEEGKKAVREAEIALNEKRRAASYENLTSSQKLEALNDAINDTIKEIISGNLSDLEVIKKKGDLVEINKRIAAEELAIKQRTQTQERELAKLAVERFEAQRKLTRDQEDLANKRGDKSKTTLGELAELTANQPTLKQRASVFGEDHGLSDEAIAAKASAREIQDLEAQQERLRKSGDVSGASALEDQIGTKRDTLVKSGFLKSTEGDEFKALKETIHKDSVDVQKILTETKTVLEGKYVSN